MINTLHQSQSDIITPDSYNPTEIIDYISSYIDTHHCEDLCVELSYMNVLDACRVSTICSTKHYIKYPNGKISWKISSELIREFNKDLELGNSEYIL